MEAYIPLFILIFIIGIILGIVGMLSFSKYKTGSMSSTTVKKEYEEYQDSVEKHFEETSQRLQDMTSQYQELYKHLAVGATTLCRPESVAAGIADKSDPELQLENQSDEKATDELEEATDEAQASEDQAESNDSQDETVKKSADDASEESASTEASTAEDSSSQSDDVKAEADSDATTDDNAADKKVSKPE